MYTISRLIILFLCVTYIHTDDIDVEVTSGSIVKLLRAMVNQTKADTLNLPANSTSIRENITDTFSCENRTYGYYADVDNDCQIFHVCLPSQTPSGRNITYRWSFICPGETIFNQEVLVCARPRDSIDCEDAPLYYDINLEFGKIPKENEEQPENNNKVEETNTNKDPEKKKDVERIKIKNQKRKQINRKQNIIVETLLKEANQEMEKAEEMETVLENNEDKPYEPILIEAENESQAMKDENILKEDEIIENSRLDSERSLKWNERKLRRGSFRFKADV